jgi:hypothetical protein
MALNSNLSIIHKYFSELDNICSLWTQDWRLWYSSLIQTDFTTHLSNCFFFRIRESTWQTLLILQNGLLSKIMWTILSQDSISPVLYDKYYPALDRRLQNILNEVKKCIATKSLQNVIVTDR